MKENIMRYLPTVESDINWGMTVTGVGYQYTELHSAYPVKGHPKEFTFNPKLGRSLNSYAIVYITRGSGVFISGDAGKKELKQGDLFIVIPNQWHTYYPNPETGWDEYWISFNGDFFKQAIETIRNSGNPIISVGLDEEVVKLFHRLQVCAQSDAPGSQQLMCGILLHIIGLVYSNSLSQTFIEKDLQKVQKACIMMRENVIDKIKPEDIASSLNMSYSSFRKLFKQYTTVAPHQYILKLKLEKIKELLGSTDLPIQEIAANMGFESADYFSYFFRSKTGINPLAYRKEIEHQREKAGVIY